MNFHPYNIIPGMKLWYRKKNSWDVDYLIVQEIGEGGFSFRLPNGRISRCTYKYASGRLFKDRSALSTETQEVEDADYIAKYAYQIDEPIPGYEDTEFLDEYFAEMEECFDPDDLT